MRDGSAFHLHAVRVGRLDGALAHLGTRNEAIARGDDSAQVLQAIGTCCMLGRVAVAAAREKRLGSIDKG